MKALTIIIGAEGRRECGDGDRVSIGGRTADIPLAGDDTGNEYAYIQCRDGHPWLTPGGPTVPVLLNARRVTEPVPVRDGDRIEVGDRTLACDLADNTLSVREGEAAPAEVSVPRPVSGRRKSGRGVRLALLGVFGALLAAAGFVFTAVPVSISVAPAPDRLQISGTLPAVELRGRYLLFPGSYEINAEKAGYVRLNEKVQISADGRRSFDFELDKLPGRLTVSTRPVSGAALRIDGQSRGATPVRDLEVAAGSRRLELTAERYLPQQLEVEVTGMGQVQTMEIELFPAWAPVSIESIPAGAALWIDGEAAGTTPATIELLAGRHRAELRLPRHDGIEFDIEVTAGEAQRLPPYTLAPSAARLAISSDPDTAAVTVDGRFAGTTPLEIEVSPDLPHQVALSKAGHRSVTRSITLAAAASGSLEVSLPAEYGTLFVVTEPADAELYVDGRERGRGAQRLRLSTLPHTLEFRKPGYQPHRVTITPRADTSKEVAVTLKPLDAAAVNSPLAEPTTAQGQRLRLIRPGRFTMGASRREQGRRANERLREVVLTRPFYLSAREVTNAEFRRFRPDHDSGVVGGRSLNGDDQPVVGVGWEDAAAYLNWLSEKEGLTPVYRQQGERLVAVRPPGNGYRLPTEAEWEYAARVAGREVAAKYAWDGAYPPSGAAGNYADRAAGSVLTATLSSYDDGHAVTAPVASFPANPAGIHDMGGNVAEWCHDFYDAYLGQVAVSTDPLGPEEGRHHVVRGAGWRDATISELRLSYRDYSDKPRQDLGFRIARYAD